MFKQVFRMKCSRNVASFVFLMNLFVWDAHASQKITEDFESTALDSPPSDWIPGQLGSGFNSNWKTRLESSTSLKNKAVCRQGNASFSYLLKDHIKLKNGSVEARFKILSGKEDPEAGVFFRFVDPNNYLYVRANSLEKNVVFYRMSKGKKTLIKSAEAKVLQGAWQKIWVSVEANVLKVRFDDQEIMNFKFSDDGTTGNTGFWTTADTHVCFDDFGLNP